MSLNPRIEHWQGRTVWVVGASSGIGQALAPQLHAAGATVLVAWMPLASARLRMPCTIGKMPIFFMCSRSLSSPMENMRPSQLLPLPKASIAAAKRFSVASLSVDSSHRRCVTCCSRR